MGDHKELAEWQYQTAMCSQTFEDLPDQLEQLVIRREGRGRGFSVATDQHVAQWHSQCLWDRLRLLSRSILKHLGLPQGHLGNVVVSWGLAVTQVIDPSIAWCVDAIPRISIPTNLSVVPLKGYGTPSGFYYMIYSSRELEETLNKIREILSDDKHDWDQRTNALKKVRSLLVAGAAQYDGFFQHLRLLDGAFKLSAKDLRSQVVREACITVACHNSGSAIIVIFSASQEVSLDTAKRPTSTESFLFSSPLQCDFGPKGPPSKQKSAELHGGPLATAIPPRCQRFHHLSTVLGNKFDHGAEAIVPTLFNLVPNSAKVMATSGCAAIRFIIRHTHVPRLIPLITSNCTSKSVAVRRRSFEFLDLLLQEWQTHSLERHAVVLVETIKKGIHDADAEARVEARKTYLGLRNHFPGEAEVLYNSLEPSYQRSLQTYLKNSGSIASLPQSDRSSSSSQESLNGSKAAPTLGTLQRSCSDIDVNAAAGAKARHAIGQPSGTGRLGTAGLPPGSYASL
ncbi:CLIP-associating protein 2, partial [Ophiophagus hannah]